jgi:hypothetical protein
LWRMVTESDQADPQIFWVSKLARREYVSANFLDVLGGGTDVRPLASRAILNGECFRAKHSE